MAAVLVSILIDMDGAPWFLSRSWEPFYLRSRFESCSAHTDKCDGSNWGHDRSLGRTGGQTWPDAFLAIGDQVTVAGLSVELVRSGEYDHVPISR